MSGKETGRRQGHIDSCILPIKRIQATAVHYWTCAQLCSSVETGLLGFYGIWGLGIKLVDPQTMFP